MQALDTEPRGSVETQETDRVTTPRGGWLVPFLTAAAVGAVVLAGVGLGQLDLDVGPPEPVRPTIGPDDGRGEVTHATNGQVEDTFSCPSTIPYNFGSGESPLQYPARDGPRAFADEMGAARFELIGGPEATVLRLGNADGSLASLNTMHRGPDGWVLDDMTACYGEGSSLLPTKEPGRLGRHGVEPWPREEVSGGWPGAVLVDDRQFFNAAGVIGHRSLFAHPCQRDICLAAGDGTVVESARVPPDAAPSDLTGVFLPDQPLIDWNPPYTLLAVYDRQGQLERATWTGAQSGGEASIVEGPGWTGRLFLVLAPQDAVSRVTVHPRFTEPVDYAVP